MKITRLISLPYEKTGYDLIKITFGAIVIATALNFLVSVAEAGNRFVDDRYIIQIGPERTLDKSTPADETTYAKVDPTEYPGYETFNDVPLPLPEYVFLVNRTKQTMTVMLDGSVVSKHKVIIGKSGRDTPTMVTDFDTISVNPVWDVPDIVVPDMIAKFRRMKNPTPYIKKLGYYFVDGEIEIAPESINWKEVTTENIWFEIKQRPGHLNMLGEVLFVLNTNTSNDVRMHSTANPELFNKPDRRFSSGCIRVDGISTIAAQLLEKTPDQYHELLASHQNQWFRLPYKVTVKVVD